MIARILALALLLPPYPTAIGEAVSLPPPPAPPTLYYSTAGQLRASWEGGGTLHEALGLRPLYAAPLVCRASPCAPPVEPGAVLIVSGPGGESAGEIVPPRGWRIWAPLVEG